MFKAVVVVFLNGGCDSFNVLVPYSGCEANIGRDLYEEYSTVRGVAALGKNQLLEIDVPTGTQPCDKFGVHKSLPLYRDQYVLGNLAFLANIGTLASPLTKADFNNKVPAVPRSSSLDTLPVQL